MCGRAGAHDDDPHRYEAELAAIHGDSDDELECADGSGAGPSPAAAARRVSVDKRKSVDGQRKSADGQAAATAPAPAAAAGAGDGRLTTNENTNAGALRQGTYGTYVEACGGWGLVGLIGVLFVAYSGAQVGQNSWLSYWSEHREDHSQQWFLNVYIGIGGLNILALLTRNLTYCLSGLMGAHRMHERLLTSVIRAPLSFFHVTPTGRILNRFSQDTYTIDEKVSDTMSSWISNVLWVASTVLVVAVATPRFLVAVPLIISFYTYVQVRVYISLALALTPTQP